MKRLLSPSKLKTALFQFFLFILWVYIGWRAREILLNKDIVALEQMRLAIIENVYYKAPPPSAQELTYAASRGMLNAVDDPRAVFMEPIVAQAYVEDKQSLRAGIGFRVEQEAGRWTVISVNPGEAAEKAGLQRGDAIIRVGDVPIYDYTAYTELSMLIRGRANTPLNLSVERGGETVEIRAIRKEAQPVRAKMLESDIAYLRSDEFSMAVTPLFKENLSELLSHNPKGLIWDLRYNGGGTQEALLETMGFFLDGGPAFYVETRNAPPQLHQAVSGELLTGIPLLVLIGPGSYSAPEVAASAVQENGRGKLVGQPTYGKGTINQFFSFANGSGLQLTTSHWLTLSQNWLEREGVKPDICLEDNPQTPNDEALDYAAALLRGDAPASLPPTSRCQ